MSALDDLIARDTGSSTGGASALDALIARDTGAIPDDVPRVEVRGTSDSTEAPGKMLALGGGLGHGLGTTMLGAQQLLGRALTGMGSDNAGPWLTNDAEQGIKRLDAQYAPLSDAHPIIAGTGNIGGQIGATMLPAGAIAKMAPAYSALGLGGKVALGAAQGAAGSAMMPVEDPEDSFASQKLGQVGLGAGLGGAIPAVASGATALGRGAWNVLKPVVQPEKFVGQGMAAAMNPAEAAQAAANIRSAQQFVPGSMPTTAQAAQTPFMVQTEKAASNLPSVKAGMIDRGIVNNDARWNALMGVARTPDELAAAQAARSTAVEPLYDAAHQQTTNVGKAFINFARRPAIQQAMQQADTLAKNEGVQLKWPSPDDRAISGHALDYTSRALGDMIDAAKRAGNNQQARALTDAQDYLKSWTQSYIPEVRQAAQTYAQMSVPVNTMEAGQQIANTLGTRAMNAGGVPDMQLAGYRTALAQATKNAEFGIDPAAHGALQGIGQDLQRSSISNSIRSPGSDTAYNLAANGWLAKNLYGPSFEGATGLGKGVAAGATLLSGHPMAAAGILAGGNKLGQMVGGRLESRLSGLLLNPNSLLPYLDARLAAPSQLVPQPFMRGLLDYGRPALVNGLLGSLVEPGHE